MRIDIGFTLDSTVNQIAYFIISYLSPGIQSRLLWIQQLQTNTPTHRRGNKQRQPQNLHPR
jgi:hypothetical protein